uniref:Uncharacterized protein n=2 Tax=Caenorhabditis japonica TaxID=281687 RepID=A0A8R1I2P4_CAEJA
MPKTAVVSHYFDTYNGLIPVFCMLVNVGLIVYLHFERKKKFGKLVDNNSRERSLLIQSVSTTSFLLIYDITHHIICFFEDHYFALSTFQRRVIYYIRTGSVALSCFFIYFICNPVVRKIILERFRKIVQWEKQNKSTGITKSSKNTVFTIIARPL